MLETLRWFCIEEPYIAVFNQSFQFFFFNMDSFFQLIFTYMEHILGNGGPQVIFLLQKMYIHHEL